MKFVFIFFFALISIFISTTIYSQDIFPEVLSVEEQSKVIDQILEDRLDNLLPQLMRREGIDMWILISREYNEDPV